MITVEGKLDVFTKLVLEKVQGEYEDKKREIDKRNNEVLVKHREAIKKKADKIIDDMTGRGEVEKNRLVSKAKIEKKRAVLNKKEELLTNFVKKIEKMAFQFTYEDGYGEYLRSSLVEVLENLKSKEHIALYITDRDQERFKKMLEELIETRGSNADKVEILSLDRDFIGGVIGVDEEKTIKVDCSIKTKIDDNRSFIGRILYRELADNG
ncbi:V-type ATP synthase subunit E [Wukongibacter baidiensis]|uniref:V-type ATP synthase subunit E n=1 Tax=Wukongibacter baidiensis TaxID=1723361 RepID=UPI003D7FF454